MSTSPFAVPQMVHGVDCNCDMAALPSVWLNTRTHEYMEECTGNCDGQMTQTHAHPAYPMSMWLAPMLPQTTRVSVSQWTIGDLAEMTQLAAEMAADGQQYCTYCMVVPVATSIGMCDGCIKEMCSYLFETEEAYYARIVEESMYQAQFNL